MPRGSKSARGTISVALPAANGMKARIGLDGKGWASAVLEPRAIAAAMIAGYQQDFISCLLHAGAVGKWESEAITRWYARGEFHGDQRTAARLTSHARPTGDQTPY